MCDHWDAVIWLTFWGSRTLADAEGDRSPNHDSLVGNWPLVPETSSQPSSLSAICLPGDCPTWLCLNQFVLHVISLAVLGSVHAKPESSTRWWISVWYGRCLYKWILHHLIRRFSAHFIRVDYRPWLLLSYCRFIYLWLLILHADKRPQSQSVKLHCHVNLWL